MSTRNPSSDPERRLPLTLWVVVACICAARLWVFVSAPVGIDEAWSVVVTRRMLHGEQLYRDIFVGTTPLAFQIQYAIARLTTNSVLMARLATVLMTGGTIALLLAAARRLRVGLAARAVLSVASVLTIGLQPNALYTALSTLLLAGVTTVAVGMPASATRRVIVVGAVLCGMALATKQNVGVLLSGGFVVCWLATRRRPWVPSEVALIGAGVALPLVVALSPTVVRGDLARFVQFTIANKTTYVAQAGVDYRAFLNLTPVGEVRAFGWIVGMRAWAERAIYLLPFALTGLVAIALWRGVLDAGARIVLIMTAVALAATYPRPDPEHFQLAIPSLLLASLVLLDRVQDAISPTVRMLVGAGLSVVLAAELPAGLTRPARWVTSADAMEALRGLRLRPAYVDSLRGLRGEFQALPADSRVLLVHPAAPLLYPLTGLRNPTPYDYPMVTPFGPHGQQAVLDEIAAGRIEAVCLLPSPWTALEPTLLTAQIPLSMRLVSRGHVCTRYDGR